MLASASSAAAGMADRVGATFALMIDDFIKAFSPLEGLVIGSEGSTLYLDIGESGGAQVGQEFTIFRKGEEFHHPITRKVLGRYEEVLGYAQIRAVQPRFSEALYVPIEGRPLPQSDDGVRITRGRIKVAITPVLELTESKGKADLRRVPYLLAVGLEGSKRFQVVDPLTVSDLFATGGAHVQEVLALPERVVRVSKKFDVSGWIVPMLIERRGVIYLDATWISAVTGTALFSRRAPLLPPAAAEEQRFPWEPASED
ncbi:MAG: hypothetical protein DME01_21045 [Candidatus Rokuibacteriota bacterium]|nr:MAG: hypothetical protein DME01_21045 [Candidatus Rokubacteria bacterium]